MPNFSFPAVIEKTNPKKSGANCKNHHLEEIGRVFGRDEIWPVSIPELCFRENTKLSLGFQPSQRHARALSSHWMISYHWTIWIFWSRSIPMNCFLIIVGLILIRWTAHHIIYPTSTWKFWESATLTDGWISHFGSCFRWMFDVAWTHTSTEMCKKILIIDCLANLHLKNFHLCHCLLDSFWGKWRMLSASEHAQSNWQQRNRKLLKFTNHWLSWQPPPYPSPFSSSRPQATSTTTQGRVSPTAMLRPNHWFLAWAISASQSSRTQAVLETHKLKATLHN